jgi:RND family efflux transporter MFP subunit
MKRRNNKNKNIIKMKAGVRITAYVALATLVLATSCSSGKKQPEKINSATNSNKVQVKVSTVHIQDVQQIADFSGTIVAFVRNNSSSVGSSRIEKIYVEVGDRVNKGQILVQMERSNYLQAKTQLENLKTEYTRALALKEAGGVSQQQLDQLKTQLDVAETTLKNLDENTKLLSPITGVVTARNFDNGDVSGSQPILSVQQLDPLKVIVNVSEEYFSKIKKGQSVDIKLDVYPGKLFKGKVSLIYPTIDAATRTFSVEITVQNESMLVRPGMFARVTIDFGTERRVVVDDIAVQKQSGTNERYVYVIDKNVAHRRVVVLGQRLSDKYEVMSGLKDNEQVAIAGITRLSDGTEVEVVEQNLN